MEQKNIEITLFLPKDQKFVNKNDLKGVTPMKTVIWVWDFLSFFVKAEIASDRLSFLPKMGLEFFRMALSFFENAQKKPELTGFR